jgi:hypothetical protein
LQNVNGSIVVACRIAKLISALRVSIDCQREVTNRQSIEEELLICTRSGAFLEGRYQNKAGKCHPV